jgi:hypothetical protein
MALAPRMLPDGFAVPVAVAAAALAVVAAPSASAKQQPTAQVGYHVWTTSDDFAAGSFAGTQPASVGDGAIAFDTSTGTLGYTDPFDAAGTLPISYDYDTWTSPVYDVGFGLTELVSSWTADTPPGTWIQVEMHGTNTTGVSTKWYVMGRWSSQMPSDTGDIPVRRSAVRATPTARSPSTRFRGQEAGADQLPTACHALPQGGKLGGADRAVGGRAHVCTAYGQDGACRATRRRRGHHARRAAVLAGSPSR